MNIGLRTGSLADVDDFAGRNLSFDGIQEADELLMAMTLHIGAGHAAIEDVEGGEQRRGAMALVVVGHGPAPALLHRQSRLGPVKRLDLAFFVDGEHERVRGRRHVQSGDVSKFFNELWVFREFELPHPVRGKPVAAPDAQHRAHRNARCFRHGGRGPMSSFAGRRSQCQLDGA